MQEHGLGVWEDEKSPYTMTNVGIGTAKRRDKNSNVADVVVYSCMQINNLALAEKRVLGERLFVVAFPCGKVGVVICLDIPRTDMNRIVESSGQGTYVLM